MTSEFKSAGGEVQHAYNTGFVVTCQKVKLFYEFHTLLLIIHSSNKVGYAIDDHQMHSCTLVVKTLQALTNDL